MEILVNLDVMMAKRKISAGELAERVGITPANLSILKNNKAKAIRFSTLMALCRELQCQPGDLLEFVDGRVLIAHNAHGFDIRFLKACAERYGVPFGNTYIDTLPLAQALYLGLRNYKLDTIGKYLEIPPFQHHRACDALPRAKAVEQAADDGEARVGHGLAAERLQCAGIGHARGTGAAAVQIADQVQARRAAGAPRGGVAVGVF